MTQYNSLNVKLSNSQLNTLKSRIKTGTEVTWNAVGDLNDDTNFQHNFLWTDTQVSSFVKVLKMN